DRGRSRRAGTVGSDFVVAAPPWVCAPGSRQARRGQAPGSGGAGRARTAADAALTTAWRARPAGGVLTGRMRAHRQVHLERDRPARRDGPMKLLTGLLVALPTLAAKGEPLSLFGISAGKAESTVSVPMQIVVLLTLLTLLPAAIMSIH